MYIFFWVFPRRQPLKMKLTQGSETSANYNLTPGKYPKEYIQYSNHGESLKSRIFYFMQSFSMCFQITFQGETFTTMTMGMFLPSVQSHMSLQTDLSECLSTHQTHKHFSPECIRRCHITCSPSSGVNDSCDAVLSVNVCGALFLAH